MLNKKILSAVLTGFCFVPTLTNAYNATPEYARMIYLYAAQSNTSGVARISRYYGIDIMDKNGNTALCHAINNNDPKAYHTLIKMGSKSEKYCMDRANFFAKNRFENSLAEYADSITGVQNETGSLLSRTKIPEKEGLGPATKLALKAGGVTLVGAGIAFAIGGSGGGGGGSSSGSDTDITVPDDGSTPEHNIPCEKRGGVLINGECIVYNVPGAAPKDTSTNNYHTVEYGKSANFLDTIKADYAYARGYSGYVVNRDENGALIDDGYELISSEKMKVGIIDNGFDITHPDLIDNVVKDENGLAYGYNLDYGPCRNGDNTNCYGFTINGNNIYGKIVLYGENSNEVIAETEEMITPNMYVEYFSDYPDDYDWDTMKYNPTPYIDDKEDVNAATNTEANDHGTHVMGIIGASNNNKGMHGVAPNVEMVGINFNMSKKITFSNDNFFEKAANVLVDENTKVVNMSFGYKSTGQNDVASALIGQDTYNNSHVDKMSVLFEKFAENDIVTVKAAGNEGNLLEADIISGIPLSENFKAGSEHDLSNLFITVVSVNSQNNLAYYSQKCGATQNYCIAAPGGDAMENNPIYSTVQNNGHFKNDNGNAYGYMQGTSMAAPVVTGSVALLMGAYPHLTSQQIVEIIFKTATDLGEAGVDETFGHGLLNLEAATSPIGYLNFDFSDNENQDTYSQSALRLSKSATSKILEVLPDNFVVFDEYNRGFTMKTSSLMADTSSVRKHIFENDFKAFMSKGKQSIKATDTLSFAFNTSVSGNDIHSPYGFFEATYSPKNNLDFYALYSENTILNNSKIFTRTEQNPFISLDNAFGTGLNYKLGKTSFKLDYTSGKNNFYDDEDNSDLYDNRIDAISTQLNYEASENLNIGTVFGMLKEDGSALGMIGTNSFDFNNSQTYFGGIKLSYRPINKLSLSAAYHRGYTNTSIDSSVFNMSNLESESISFNATYFLSKDNNIGFELYSPLRIVKGNANIFLATGRHPTEDKAYLNKYTASLKDDAREWDLSMFYNTKLKNDTMFKSRFGIRLNPEHEANAKPDYFGMFNLNFAF